jgi:hypothetical protein
MSNPYFSIEQLFSQDFLKSLREKEQDIKEAATSHLLSQEEYALQVGRLQAVKEIRAEFEILLKNYFSNQ